MEILSRQEVPWMLTLSFGAAPLRTRRTLLRGQFFHTSLCLIGFVTVAFTLSSTKLVYVENIGSGSLCCLPLNASDLKVIEVWAL